MEWNGMEWNGMEWNGMEKLIQMSVRIFMVKYKPEIRSQVYIRAATDDVGSFRSGRAKLTLTGRAFKLAQTMKLELHAPSNTDNE